LLGLGFVLGDIGDVGVDLGPFVFVEFDPRQPALVIDRHGREILDRTADVVNVDVVAEHGRRVHVLLFDRRAGEADEGSIGETVTQILGETVGDDTGLPFDLRLEAVLAAVRFVGDHDDVAPIRQHRKLGLARYRRELLQGGKDHPT